MKATVRIELTDRRAADLLCSALEGGSNYWIEKAKALKPSGKELFFTASDGNEDYYPRYIRWPLSIGGALVLTVEGKRHKIGRGALAKGWQIMAEKYPVHFADAISDNDDAVTGDVFLQCALFGDIVYG